MSGSFKIQVNWISHLFSQKMTAFFKSHILLLQPGITIANPNRATNEIIRTTGLPDRDETKIDTKTESLSVSSLKPESVIIECPNPEDQDRY